MDLTASIWSIESGTSIPTYASYCTLAETLTASRLADHSRVSRRCRLCDHLRLDRVVLLARDHSGLVSTRKRRTDPTRAKSVERIATGLPSLHPGATPAALDDHSR